MQLTKWVLLGSALLLSSPMFASTTYWGGFEDNIGSGADYDFNDLVYSITGNNLTLKTTTGVWFNKSSAGTLNTGGGIGPMGHPFWNNSSQDGSGGYNVGFCIYGGGVCNGGTGLAPSDLYLANPAGLSVNDVTFSVNGDVTEQVALSITIASDQLGWELASGGPVHFFPSGVQGPTSFTPGGDFALVGFVNGTYTYTSNSTASDGDSHFAFFGTAVPEPSTFGLLGLALLAAGFAFRRRLTA